MKKNELKHLIGLEVKFRRGNGEIVYGRIEETNGSRVTVKCEDGGVAVGLDISEVKPKVAVGDKVNFPYFSSISMTLEKVPGRVVECRGNRAIVESVGRVPSVSGSTTVDELEPDNF